jgi:hypothetical protein
MGYDRTEAGRATDQADRPACCSHLVISDRLIRLAEEADRAGYTATAHQLVDLACAIFDEAPTLLH